MTRRSSQTEDCKGAAPAYPVGNPVGLLVRETQQKADRSPAQPKSSPDNVMSHSIH
jgi:hypothetical protein